ncbi:hypothetical protein AALO_G00311110 [Alosa alosa]|uniref:Uncharacterized protein n=1 Tax=Alosa alosa TaxID=278164 RepID=A0AAV6FCE5_9TELE|nr:hypothetical protein AALO_G00311110 [Alosa alosa]
MRGQSYGPFHFHPSLNYTYVEYKDGASEDDVVTAAPSLQNQTTSSATDGVTDGASEDAVVLTTVLNLQNGTTSAQDGTTITDSHDDS